MARDKTTDDADGHSAQALIATMSTMLLAIPRAQIALFKAIIESYDNLATVRTEDPRRHHLRLYFAPESRDTVEGLIDSLAAEFLITRVSD
jgi:hypothetical protein